jgi:hypothetical protein
MPNTMLNPNTTDLSNQRLIDFNRQRLIDFGLKPQAIYPWWRKCTVKVLLVTDGPLNFGNGDFGLSTFIQIMLNDAPSRVHFEITLAHLATNADMLATESRITKRITDFCFDDPAQFGPTMYDEVWLFGFETFYTQTAYPKRAANPAKYPAERLGDAELKALSAYMNQGGGVFATGDHGSLGRGLCGSVNRVRNMRHWTDFPAVAREISQVSMEGQFRNDTNQAGHDVGTQFSDQSDDIPQTLDLKLYSSKLGYLHRARYPHPLLCGRDGRLDVLPDHPHEGECRIPADLTQVYAVDGTPEFPLDASGARPAPDVIAFSSVHAGNTTASNSKTPTVAHTFGAISAYDGHRANVGRVVCDATWHHFVNVNLIGVVEGGGFDEFARPGEDSSKHNGFLSSAAGLAALNKIKNYYTNIGVWIAPKARQTCFNTFAWWQLVYADRLMEAALPDPNLPFEKMELSTFLSIGTHARDAFGRRASKCQTLEWILDFFTPILPEIKPWVDPWGPWEAKKGLEFPLPVIDPMPIIDVALGAALVSMRQEFPYPPEKFTDRIDQAALKMATAGARQGLRLAIAQQTAHLKAFSGTLKLTDDSKTKTSEKRKR